MGEPGPSAMAPMTTTARRALGTTNPTIMPSHISAFVLSVKDAKLPNLSSDFLPDEISHALQSKYRYWNAKLKPKPGFSWTTVQSSPDKVRSCIEARVDKKKSHWDDGIEYTCASCEQRMRLCMVVDSEQRVLLLPRKAAENEGRGPTEATYWTR